MIDVIYHVPKQTLKQTEELKIFVNLPSKCIEKKFNMKELKFYVIHRNF